MLYRVGYDVWNPFEGTSARQFIDIEAVSGDDAAARAAVAIRGLVGERTGVKVVEIAPSPSEPKLPEEPVTPRKPGRPPKAAANAVIEGEDA